MVRTNGEKSQKTAVRTHNVISYTTRDGFDPAHDTNARLRKRPIVRIHPRRTPQTNQPITSPSLHPTDATILGLPGEEVQERSQWLADEAETDPEDNVPGHFAAVAFHFLQRIGDHDERYLKDHTSKSNACRLPC